MPDGPQESSYYEPLRQPSREITKMLPVLFVLCTIAGLYLIYMFCHCLPMLQITEPFATVDQEIRWRATVETSIFHVITLLLVASFARCVLVHPGEVPNQEPWLYTSGFGMLNLPMREVKKADGQRRHCKWCSKYKPDRTHHCRQCNACVLKMDHHCPFIHNCVGFHNYKYFFLLIMYTMLATHFIVWTMVESFVRAVDENAAFVSMFFTLFGLSLSFFLGSLATPFFMFHLWLTTAGMTTLEYCESNKRVEKADGSRDCGCFSSNMIWDIGVVGNLQVALGRNPLFWLLPLAGPDGDGMSFAAASDGTVLEGGRGPGGRRKGRGSEARRLAKEESLYGGYGAADFFTEKAVRHSKGGSGDYFGLNPIIGVRSPSRSPEHDQAPPPAAAFVTGGQTLMAATPPACC